MKAIKSDSLGPPPAPTAARTLAFSLGVAAVCFLLSLASTTPGIAPWAFDPKSGSIQEIRVPAILRQLADPLTPVEPALRWRLLLPAVGHVLHLSPLVYLCLPYVGMFALMFATCRYSFRLTGERSAAILATTVVATSSIFFISTGWIGTMDAFYVLALVVFSFTPSTALATVCCAVGPWIDERFVLVIPVYAILRLARFSGVRQLLISVAPVGGYLLVRLAALFFAHEGDTISDHASSELANMSRYLPYVPLGWWWGFRAGWFVVVLGVVAAFGGLPAVGKVALSLALTTALCLVVFLAWDTSRSIAILVPFVVIGSASTLPISPARRRALGIMIVAGNLLAPAAYVVSDATIVVGSFLCR
jgi:hypothetical protein